MRRVLAVSEAKFEDLQASIFQTNEALGLAAAEEAKDILQGAVREKGEANVILAPGNSQIAFLKALRTMAVEWSKVNIFHMDEYLGLELAHPARFDRFLYHHLLSYITPRAFSPVLAGKDATLNDCQVYETLLRENPADLCVLGIGENGHLAFNDPPYADFADPAWVKIVRLDEASRRQQVGEGHFKSLDDVPKEAVTLTIPALLAARRVLAVVPESRMTRIVYECLSGPITPAKPASILCRAAHATLFLDLDSASVLQERGMLESHL